MSNPHATLKQHFNTISDTWNNGIIPKLIEYIKIPNKSPAFDNNGKENSYMDKDPWIPVLTDGKLYGRGGADDGYSAYAALTAIAYLQEHNIPHARCAVIIEACEESGSANLPH